MQVSTLLKEVWVDGGRICVREVCEAVESFLFDALLMESTEHYPRCHQHERSTFNISDILADNGNYSGGEYISNGKNFLFFYLTHFPCPAFYAN